MALSLFSRKITFHLAGETIRAKGFKTNSMKGRKTASGLLRGLLIGVHSRPFAVPLYEE